MKKLFTTVLALTAIVLSVSASTAYKIAYVSTSTPDVNGDSLLRKELAKTYTIVDVDGTQAIATVKAACEADSIDLVIYGEALSSTATGSNGMQGVNKPMLNMKVYAWKSNTKAWSVSGTTYWGENGTALAIDTTGLSSSSHAIFSGLSSLSVLSQVGSSKGLGYATTVSFNPLFTGTVTTLADISGAAGSAAIIEFGAGTTYTDVQTSSTITIPQPMIQFGINQLSQTYITADGYQLIVNICDYLIANTVVTGTKEQAAVEFSALTVKGAIVVKSEVAETVELIDLTGNTIAKSAIDGEVTIPASKGLYIVKVVAGNTVTAKKVLVP